MSRWTSRQCLSVAMPTKKKPKKRPHLFRDKDGFVRAEDYFKLEKKRQTLEEYKAMIAKANECIAMDKEDWALFCSAFPLPDD